MAELRPVAPPERVVLLDVLRGWALLGVLVANVHSHISGRRFGGDVATIDQIAALLVHIFVANKAMTLLTILFGLGFAIQLLRAEERGEDARVTFARRLAALFCVGVSHVVLLWWGDVTWTYALSGFSLLLIHRYRGRAILWLGLALCMIPMIVAQIPEIAVALRKVLPAPANQLAFRAEFTAATQGSDHVVLAWAQLRFAFYFVGAISVWYFPWVIGRFFIGYYIGRRRLFERDGADHLPVFERLFAWGLAIGILGSAFALVRRFVLEDYVLLLPAQLAQTAIAEITPLAMVACYVSAVVFLLRRPAWRRAFRVFIPIGRMPLTAYLGQSLCATFVFYGWGLGLGGTIGAAGCVGISLAIYALEAVLCHLWLRRFRFGPVEWVWRSLAYWKLQPMRAPVAPATE